jgi:alpha-1,6-mannosyltransferase
VPVTIFRAIGVVASMVIVTYLALRPQGRSGTRAAGLALFAVVILGPVVQPWYLLWFIPLLVVTGLDHRQLRAAILLTAGLSVHGMVDGSSTSDALLKFSSGISVILAIGFVAAILIASPRERRLVLQQDSGAGLQPSTPQERLAAQRTLIGPPRTG